MSRWIATPREISHITPAWFIPIVGNAVAVYAAGASGFREIAWMFFSVALLLPADASATRVLPAERM